MNGSIRNLKLGNTEVVAAKIKELLPNADLFHIDTVHKYSDSYMTCIEEAKQELLEQLVAMLAEWGCVSLAPVFIDWTKIKANATSTALFGRKVWKILKETVGTVIKGSSGIGK